MLSKAVAFAGTQRDKSARSRFDARVKVRLRDRRMHRRPVFIAGD
jgi:hypothetical protein